MYLSADEHVLILAALDKELRRLMSSIQGWNGFPNRQNGIAVCANEIIALMQKLDGQRNMARVAADYPDAWPYVERQALIPGRR